MNVVCEVWRKDICLLLLTQGYFFFFLNQKPGRERERERQINIKTQAEE